MLTPLLDFYTWTGRIQGDEKYLRCPSFLFYPAQKIQQDMLSHSQDSFRQTSMLHVKLERFLELGIVVGQSYCFLIYMFSENTQYINITWPVLWSLYGTATQTKPSASGYEDDTLMLTLYLILEILAHTYFHKTRK